MTARATVLDRVGAFMAEAVMPVYVLHQTVIVMLGFHVVEWPMSGALKYLIICGRAFGSGSRLTVPNCM